MANLSYILNENNLIKQAQIVVNNPAWDDSSPTVSFFPAYNAGILPVSLPARCLNHSDPMKWHVTFPGVVNVDCITLVAHNISPDATILVKGGTSFDPSTSLGTMTWKRRTAFIYFSATETTRSHFKIEISDSANIHGFSQIGYIVIGTATALSQTFQHDWDLVEEMLNQQALTEVGLPLVGNVSEREVINIRFAGLTEAEANEIRTPFRSSLKNKTPLFILPDGSTGSKGFFGRFTGDLRKRLGAGTKLRVDLTLAEDAPGPIALEAMPVIGEGIELPSGSSFSRSGTAHYKDSTLKLVSAADGVLRGNVKGGIAGISVAASAHYYSEIIKACLLLEPTRTNVWTYSEDLSQAAWTKNNVTISANDVILPDGTTTADNSKAIETTASGNHGIGRDLAGSPSDDTFQAVSFFVQPGTKNRIAIRTTNKAGTVLTTEFDASDGSVNTNEHVRWEAKKYISGNYRCKLAFDAGSGGTTPSVEIRITQTNANWVQSYAGSTSDNIYIWGLQDEADSSFCSSYIATGAATTTRNEDILYVPYDFDTQPMSFYTKFVNISHADADEQIAKIGSAVGTADPRFELKKDADNQYPEIVFDDGTTAQGRTGSDAIALGDIVEILGLLHPNGNVELDYSINGAAVTGPAATGSQTFGVAFADDRLYLGRRGTSGTPGVAPVLIQSVKTYRGVHSMATMRNL
jgi:hypothetical protein